MKLNISKDYFNNPVPPNVYLCTTGKKIIGQLPAYELSGTFKWGSYSELTFSLDRQYVDVLTGEVKTHPLFNKAEGLRGVLVEDLGYFIVQDPDTSYGEKDSKTITCFSGEYGCTSKFLENFRINTGDVDSLEVAYLSDKYGDNYTIDTPYEAAEQGNYKASEKYYVKTYTDEDSYAYEQQHIIDADDYASHFADGSNAGIVLYVQKYPNIQFYNEDDTKRSLLHYIFEKIPEWNIGTVDANLQKLERTFDETRISVYDFFMNEIQDAFSCVVEWDTLKNEVNFYEEVEDGITEDNEVATRWDTDVFISQDNLASELNVSYSTDDIKTRLRVSGGTEDLDIRDINLGNNYITNLDYYHDPEWMEPDLLEAYQDYLDAIAEHQPSYLAAAKNRIAAYNRWNDLMNAVPAEGGVVLVGDDFEKLYCVYEPYDTAYTSGTITPNKGDTLTALYSDEECTDDALIESTDGKMYVVQGYTYQYVAATSNYKCLGEAKDVNLAAFIKKLNLYHVNEDVQGNKPDNTLLTLKNSQGDTATIRIYDPHQSIGVYDPNVKYYYTKRTDDIYDEVTGITADNFSTYEDLYTNNYMIQVLILRASSGLKDAPLSYSLSQWVEGDLTSTYLGLLNDDEEPDFKVASIGTMGAYFCLAKSETSPAVLQDYGVYLLRDKHDTYMKVFKTQTEAMFSNQNYQCVVQDDEPAGNIANGVRWLDTNSNPVTLKCYDVDAGGWVNISQNVSEADRGNYENYQRYLDNYDNLVAVQEVLVEKETQAEYCLSGYEVQNRTININNYTQGEDGVLRDGNGEELRSHMQRAAASHFGLGNDTEKISYVNMDNDLPLYTFKYLGTDYAVYLNDNKPYVSYPNAQAVYQTQMNRLHKLTTLENYLSTDQLARLSPFIREDEYTNDNLILTGYESDEERLSRCEELLQDANKELNKLSQPSLKFSMTMANIFALPEFSSLISQFQLGNFIRVNIKDDYTKRARLLEAQFSFDDLSDFSCTFGDLVTTKSEIDKHKDLMAQTVQAGRSYTASKNTLQKAAIVSNKLAQDIDAGLKDATLEIGAASGQDIQIGEDGIWGRKRKETGVVSYEIGATDTATFNLRSTPETVYVENTAHTPDEWEDEQFRIINNKFAFTNDNWKTSKSVFGKYMINGEERWGILAEAITAGLVESCVIEGGVIKIGKQSDGTYAFEVTEDGTVTMGGGSKIGGVTVSELNDALFNNTDATIHTSQPSSYKVGDLWILADGEECGEFGAGSLLKAIESSNDNSLNIAHWVDAVKNTTEIIANIRESFTWDNTGIKVAKRVTNANREVSTPFYVHITSERMGFHSQTVENGRTEDTEVVHVGNKSATIQNATLEGADGTIVDNELEVRDDANFYGAVNIYNDERTNGFMWQTETNGSFSLVVL